jgi:hypothetical protein
MTTWLCLHGIWLRLGMYMDFLVVVNGGVYKHLFFVFYGALVCTEVAIPPTTLLEMTCLLY